MDTVSIKRITFGQLDEGNWIIGNDCFGLAAFVNENVIKTFKEGPFCFNPDKTAVMLAVDNGNIVGRFMLYGTRLRVGDSFIDAQSFGSIEVDVSQRGKGIASRMNQYPLNNDEYPMFFCGFLSTACHSIMRKPETGCVIFDYPQYIKINNVAPILKQVGLPNFIQRVGATMGNSVLWILDTGNRIRLKKINKKFIIEELTEVPEWAGDMCMNDGHKYSEVHNREWLQWCLSYNLSGKPQDKQHFYAIYNRNKQPAGFFFTKVRLLEDVGKYGSFMHGVLCEWATINQALTEDDINLLAFNTMPRECYHFTTVTVDSLVEKKLHKKGFLRHGSQQMGYKDKLGKYPDMKDRSNWRIRFGCCNSIVF